MSLSYTNDLKGFRGSVQAGEEQVLEVITQEELDTLRGTLQKLADAFNPDKDLVWNTLIQKSTLKTHIGSRSTSANLSIPFG